MSGTKIIFHKCDIFHVNVELDNAHIYAQAMCFKLGTFPLEYLGVPLHFEKLRKEDLEPVIDKAIKKAGGWKWNLLSGNNP
jgi:hypothetical protein